MALVVFLVALFILYWLVGQLQKWRYPPTVPLAGRDGWRAKIGFVRDARFWLWDGVDRFKGKMFRLWTPDGYLHIATSEQLAELNRLGDDHLRVAFTDVVSGLGDVYKSLRLIVYTAYGPIHKCHYVTYGTSCSQRWTCAESCEACANHH